MKVEGSNFFEEVVDAHYRALYRFAFTLSRNEHDACDLTQQTFTIFAKNRESLRDSSKVKSWLFTTLYREFIRQNKKNKRTDHQDPDQLAKTMVLSETPDLNQSDHPRILAALHQLDEVYRAPLTLYYLQNLSYREIAESLAVPIGTIMSRLSRGKNRLKEIFLESEELTEQ